MRLPEELIFEYQQTILQIESALEGKSLDVVIPAAMCFLGAAAAFHGMEKKQFITWVVERIDEAYDEYERRVR